MRVDIERLQRGHLDFHAVIRRRFLAEILCPQINMGRRPVHDFMKWPAKRQGKSAKEPKLRITA